MRTILSILCMMSVSLSMQSDFLTEQKKYDRVRKAYEEKWRIVAGRLKEINIQPDELNLLILVLKEEKQLEIYGKKKGETIFNKITTYSICHISGQPGPKRKQGDNQVPEGFYYIDRFNPVSNFYLSLGINYPNESDRKKSQTQNPGGDIFIHGSCVTIGCIPMTDDRIKEIYLYAIQAKQNGQLSIPVYIFPFRMTDQMMQIYKTKYRDNTVLLNFWDNLKTGYRIFEKDKQELDIAIDPEGNYLFR